MDIFEIVMSLCGVIGSSTIISSLVLKRIDKLEKQLENREKYRVEEDIVKSDTLHAVGKLTTANTYAIRAITTDCACESELSSYIKAKEKLEHFIIEKTAEFLHAS